MKILLKVRQNFEMVGIKGHQKHRLNPRSISMLFFLGQFTITTAVFFGTQTKHIDEYAFSFYAFVTGLGTIVSILSSLQEMTRIYELIYSMENLIEKSS